MLSLILALVLSAEPAVLDAIDPDGDGSITDAEFAAGCKALAALNKSKKKPDQALVEKLDTDGDGKLSEEEILEMAAEARKGDSGAKYAINAFTPFDTDKDGIATKEECSFVVQKYPQIVQQLDRVRRADANKDKNITLLEVLAAADAVNQTPPLHPGNRNQTLWQRAVQAMRVGGSDKRINKLESAKVKEIHDAFDEIDADGDERIKLIELFNWMCDQ